MYSFMRQLFLNDLYFLQRCIPSFENAAFALEVNATNTCGQSGPTEFCVQSGSQVTKKTCDVCSQSSHSPYYMTDFSSYANRTWWQSETMYENVQYPNQVNLTLHFGTKLIFFQYFVKK